MNEIIIDTLAVIIMGVMIAVLLIGLYKLKGIIMREIKNVK